MLILLIICQNCCLIFCPDKNVFCFVTPSLKIEFAMQSNAVESEFFYTIGYSFETGVFYSIAFARFS